MKELIEEHKKFLNNCKHILWLFKQMAINFLKGDIDGSIETWYFIRIHWNYKSVKTK